MRKEEGFRGRIMLKNSQDKKQEWRTQGRKNKDVEENEEEVL